MLIFAEIVCPNLLLVHDNVLPRTAVAVVDWLEQEGIAQSSHLYLREVLHQIWDSMNAVVDFETALQQHWQYPPQINIDHVLHKIRLWG